MKRLIPSFALALALTFCSLKGGAQTTVKEWRTLDNLPTVVSGHCLVQYDERLLIIGGIDAKGRMRPDVLRASIGNDGIISAWSKEEALPNPVTGHSAGAGKGEIFVCGGMIEMHGMRQPSSMVWRAKPSRSGRVRAWQEEKPMPVAVYGQAQATSDRFIYIVGGMTSGGHSNKLMVGRLASGGGISEWREGLALPAPLVRAAALIVGKYILVAGGVTPGQGKTIAVPTVYAAPIWEDGMVKTWYLASAKLPGAWLGFGRSDATLVYHGKSLFCIGGMDALWFAIRNLARAPFNPETGELGPWGLMDLPAKFPQITQAAVYGDRLYVVGGQADGRASSSVMAADLVEVKKNE